MESVDQNLKAILMESKIFAIIQARMSSTRLHGKVLKELSGQPILYHIIQRIKSVKDIDQVIIATSQKQSDDPIQQFANERCVSCFRGSENDVLGRFFKAAQVFGAGEGDIIIRLTADNPFVDPRVCEELLSYFRENFFNYVTTEGYPLGVGVEIFSFCALEEAFMNAQKPYEREHVTPFMYRPGQVFGKLKSTEDHSDIRLTVDTLEDYRVAQIVYNSLYREKECFKLPELLDYLKNHPDIIAINKDVHQKQLGE